MPDSKVINNPFLDDQNTNKVTEQSVSKFDPSTAKPVQNKSQVAEVDGFQFDPSTAKAVNKGFSGHARDLGASLMGGLAAVPDIAVGVADLYTGGRAGKAVDNLSDNFKLGQAQKYWQDQKTDQAKVQSQQFSDAEGIIDKTKVALSNPSMIANTVTESLPSMAVGGLAGRGINIASKGAIGAAASGAIGEGAVMAGSQAEQIRQKTDDGLLTGKQTAAVLGTGVAGSLLGFLGGTVAKKLGFEDVDTLMARGVKPEQVAQEITQIPFSSIPKSVVLGAISEGLLEEMPQSVTEQVLQNYALDKDLFEGVDDAIVMGTLAGMAMGGTVAGTSQASKWAGQPNSANPDTNDNADTTGSNPLLPAPTGGDGGTGLGFDGLQGEYIPAGQQGATDPVQARQNFEYDQMPTDAERQIEFGGLSRQYAPTPSQQMGLDPNLGPLSAAAATAVDTGISQQFQIEMQTQTVTEQTDTNAPLQQTVADEVRQLTPEQIHGTQNKYSPEVVSALEALRQRQQGEQSGSSVTLNESTQNEAAQRGNTQTNNGGQPRSEQSNAASQMGDGAGTAQDTQQFSSINSFTDNQRADTGRASSNDGSDRATTQAGLDVGIGSSGNIKIDTPAQAEKGISNLDTAGQTFDVSANGTRSKLEADLLQAKSNIDKQISKLETQLSTEKSVPKKLQLRKQLENLNAERATITKNNESAMKPESLLREGARNDSVTTSSFQTQPLDHGALNVPLSKRGNIDAQLDQYKKEQTALENGKREIQKGNHADAQAIAKPMFDTLSIEQIKTYANKAGIKPSEAKKELKSMAHWQPQKAVKVFEALKEVGTKLDKPVTPPTLPNLGGVEQIQALEQQLAVEKSIPKKTQIRKQIAELQKHSPIDQAAHQAATSIQNDLPEPTQAQIEAGNYKKGHIKVHGLDIAIENPRGSERRGTDPDGKEWSHQMSDHYGYLKTTTGADNEQIDTYVGSNPESEQVFIVDQLDQQTSGFDEHKVMLGFNSKDEAVKAYSSNFDKGWKVGPVHTMTKDEFKTWLKEGDTTKPAGESIQQSKIFTQIQSDSGLTHSIPIKLMDQVHELGSIVNDLTSIKTEGVKTNVLYGKQLLAKIAKLNPDVQIHIISDLNNIQDKTIRAGLVDGGYYVPAQNTSYIYPNSKAWQSSALELVNHELVHSVSEQIIFDSLLPQEYDQKLNKMIAKIGDYLFENSELLSENVTNRLSYAFNTNPQHEVLAVGIAESEVRESLKNILGNTGLLELDGIFTAITEQYGNSNEQRKQRSDTGNGEKILHGTVPSTDTGAAGKLQDIPAGTERSKKHKRSIRDDQTDLSTGEKQQGLDGQSDQGDTPEDAIKKAGKLYSYAGQSSLGIDSSKLNQAFSMMKQGVYSELIRKETGWFLGYDKKWRYEINDRNASLKYSGKRASTIASNAKRNLGKDDLFLADVFNHDELFKAYPQLKNIKFEISDDNLFAGGYNPHSNTMSIDTGSSSEEMLSTVLHEMQHAIQDIEGFARGGNSFEFLQTDGVASYADGNPFENEFQEALLKFQGTPEYDRIQNEMIQAMISDDAEKSTVAYNKMQNFIKKNGLSDLEDRMNAWDSKNSPSAKYNRLAGEVESRDVEARKNLSDHERLNQKPYESQGIPHEDVIVRFNNDAAQRTDTTAQQVRQKLEQRYGKNLIARLQREGKLEILDTHSEASAEGWYQNGKVTLVADVLTDDSIIPTFLHELGGHGGFQNIMSEEKYADLMGIFNDMVQRKHPLALEAKRLAERETDAKTQQLEYLPYLLTLASTQQEMNALQKSAIKRFIDKVVSAVKAWAFDRLGINLNLNENDMVALANRMVNQIGNQAQQNTDTNQNPLYSRSSDYSDITNRISNGLKNLPKTGEWINKKGVDWLGVGLGFLSRRHLTEVYSKLLPQLNKYNELAAQMDADKNDIAAEADNIVREWSKLKDEEALANVMHDATLAQIDPAKPHQPGDDRVKYQQLRHAYNKLSPEAQAMYKKARNAYSGHYAKVREAIRERILRSALSSQKKADLLKNIEGSFGQIKGVYFPLARFGRYVVVMRNKNGDVEVVSRAETMNEAEAMRDGLITKYPQFKADDVKKDAEFNASRDSVGRGFMSDLFDEVGNLGLDTKAQAEFEDTLSQLYLSSMPDLSWAKHGIHRKGTAGFSQDARRAFAQHMFSGANYLGKLRYGDQLAQQLDEMKKHSNEQFNKGIGYDQRSAQSVIDEMEKRHELLMNPKGNPLSSFLTSVGFMYYMGLSPAAAMVNLSQTALIAYPLMGAKWNYDKAGKELLKASRDFAKGVEFKVPDFSNMESFKNSIGDVYSPNIDKVIKGLELDAYNKAVKRGVIDVTQAHDLAGIAQGEDSKVMWYFRPAMRLASGMFHHAERFNREVTFIAAYRLASQAGASHTEAFDQAMDMVYRGHFDYSAGNRARFMQGNIAKVVLLFKQYAQNMLYTLLRNAHQSIYALDPKDQREARRALAGILGMHALAAGAIGLPITGMLATASILIAKKSKLGAAAFGIAAMAALASGGGDDDPYELENVIRNWLADIHPMFADLVFGGVPRAFSPVDLSGRVGLNNLIIPDVQDGIEGADWSNAYAAALLGPVAGIGTNMAKGMQLIGEGHYSRGLESMLPIVLRNPLKAVRYADEGVLAKDGKVIQEDVGGVGVFSQAIGFSPSDVRTSMEGRSAIYAYKNKLNNGRNNLMDAWVNARREDDSQGIEEAWNAILEFNEKVSEKNPNLRINRIQLMQRYKERERKNKDAGAGGVYLTKREQGAEEQGRFAFGE